MLVIKGDLLNFPMGINLIIHQANIDGAMKSGIAGAITKRYPEAAAADLKAYGEGKAQLGHFSYHKYEDTGRIIVNLYGQSIKFTSTAGIPTDYNAVIVGLERVRKWIDTFENSDDVIIGVPYLMGCGLGGGDWAVYSKIIDKVLGDYYDVHAICL